AHSRTRWPPSPPATPHTTTHPVQTAATPASPWPSPCPRLATPADMTVSGRSLPVALLAGHCGAGVFHQCLADFRHPLVIHRLQRIAEHLLLRLVQHRHLHALAAQVFRVIGELQIGTEILEN